MIINTGETERLTEKSQEMTALANDFKKETSELE
jgi:hypothetical protein